MSVSTCLFSSISKPPSPSPSPFSWTPVLGEPGTVVSLHNRRTKNARGAVPSNNLFYDKAEDNYSDTKFQQEFTRFWLNPTVWAGVWVDDGIALPYRWSHKYINLLHYLRSTIAPNLVKSAERQRRQTAIMP